MEPYESVETGGLMAAMGALAFVYFAVILLILVSMWKIFVKAGKPGWAAIVPIYNMIVLLEIVNKPIWWFIMFFIPLVNLIFIIMTYNELSKSFGQGVGTTVLLILLPFVGFPMLAFGDAQYTRPVSSAMPV